MKKIFITIVIAFISSIIIGILPAILFYIPSQIEFANLFPGVVNEEPEPIFMLLGSLALLFLWVISFDKMGIKDYKKGALTGIWFSMLCFIFLISPFLDLPIFIRWNSLLLTSYFLGLLEVHKVQL